MNDRPDSAALERRRSKRWDERVKLLANFANGAGIATLIVSLISPAMQGTDILAEGHAVAGAILAIMSHLAGQLFLGLLRGES